jgi:hypothetical protein
VVVGASRETAKTENHRFRFVGVPGSTVAATTRRAKHFVYSEIMRNVQPLAQKYLSFRNTEAALYISRPALT